MSKPSELLRRARLTDQERIGLFTILQQWSRNSELQAQKATDWLEARTINLAEQIVREAADEAMLGHTGYECNQRILSKFGLKE